MSGTDPRPAPHIAQAHEIETFTGRYVDIWKPDPATICIEDIAHGLANTCRFGGHCRTFYSVAEHAVFVSRRLEGKGFDVAVCLAGLHHDDAEAYLGDIPRPMKPLLGEAYEELTDDMEFAIVRALAWDDCLWTRLEMHSPEVKRADNWALAIEANILLPSRGEGWGLDVDWDLNDWRGIWTGGMTPESAEALWLARHAELVAR